MNNSISTTPSVHAAQPLLPDGPFAGAARKDAPASVTGVGPAQGTLVAVGNGRSRELLHQDADDDDEVFHDAIEWAGETAADAQVVETKPARDLAASAAAVERGDAAGAKDINQDAARNAGAMGAGLNAATAVRIVVEPALALQRDTDAAQVQQQQQAGWGQMFGNLANMGKAALDLTLKVVDGVLQFLESKTKTESSAGVAVKPKTAREINLFKAESLASKVETEFDKLNENIRRAGGVPVLPDDPDRTDGPKLGLLDNLWRWKHAASGGAAALQATALDTGVGLALPVVAGAAATVLDPVTGMALRGMAIATAAYRCMKSMLEFPQLVTDHQVVGMIKETLKNIQPDLNEFNGRLADERGRLDVEQRILLVGDVRRQKVVALKNEILHLDKALGVARVRKSVPTPSDGSARASTLSVAGRARAAFTAFFAPIGRALDRVSRFFAQFAMPSTARRAAIEKEEAYVLSKNRTLNALREPVSGSLMNRHASLEVHTKERIEAAGWILQKPLEQLVLGENLTRTLLAQKQPNFGLLNYRAENAPAVVHRIGATLITARALAWYLDTIADLSAQDRLESPGTPEVKRNADGSLSVSDPDRTLASFLMSVPVAYTATMAGLQGDSWDAGLRIDDPLSQLPAGMAGLRFESTLDETGQFNLLHLSFTPQGASSVYQPLANEKQIIQKLRAALESATTPAGQPLQDYSDWPVEKLQQRSTELVAQQDREYAAYQQDQRQLQAIDTWKNPKFGR